MREKSFINFFFFFLKWGKNHFKEIYFFKTFNTFYVTDFTNNETSQQKTIASFLRKYKKGKRRKRATMAMQHATWWRIRRKLSAMNIIPGYSDFRAFLCRYYTLLCLLICCGVFYRWQLVKAYKCQEIEKWEYQGQWWLVSDPT